MPKEFIVILVSMLPIAELRGAIPLALSFGISIEKAFWLSVLGNAAFVAPALFLFEPVTQRLRSFKFLARFFDRFFERTRKKAEIIQRYEALGLFLFVAIPLPMTGAWTGAIAASLFKVRFRYAFAAILAGILCAGVIVSLLAQLGIAGWRALS